MMQPDLLPYQSPKTQFEKAVLPLFEANRGDWLDKARAVARRIGSGGALVTIDLVRAECPPPADVDPRVMGAVFKRSEWSNEGYVKGHRSASHARPVATFRLRQS